MMNLEWLGEAIEDAHTALLEDTNLSFDSVLAREAQKIRNRIVEEYNRVLMSLRKDLEAAVSKRIERIAL